MSTNDLRQKTMDINALKNYFENRRDVAFAFLFGSQARGTATKISDVDIAVYFYPKKRHPVEYEEEVFYPSEDEIWSDVERILRREIEMLVLNRVSASVAASAIRGIPLAINDWGLYLDFMEVVTREAEDFREMIFENFLERMKVEGRTKTEIAEAS
jgi:predicted nucleotidyltransferase